MGQRRKGREVLLQLLFQEEMNFSKDRECLLKNFWSDFPSDPLISEWAQDLYLKIADKKEELDKVIESHSQNWKMYRMSPIDRNILRTATYELFYEKETPGEVVLNEAIEIAKRFGNEDSASFVNGVLDNIWKTHKNP